MGVGVVPKNYPRWYNVYFFSKETERSFEMRAKNYINGEFYETENYLDAVDPSNLEVIGQGNKQ